MNDINLNDYVCLAPFKSMEIHKNSTFLCCPSWLSTSVENSEYNIKIYNLINIINIAELDIFKYFHINNIIINFKSRDCKRLITHFIINKILKYIKNPGSLV